MVDRFSIEPRSPRPAITQSERSLVFSSAQGSPALGLMPVCDCGDCRLHSRIDVLQQVRRVCGMQEISHLTDVMGEEEANA